MNCNNCKFFDTEYDKRGFCFPMHRCSKNVYVYKSKIDDKYYSFNDICDFFINK